MKNYFTLIGGIIVAAMFFGISAANAGLAVPSEQKEDITRQPGEVTQIQQLKTPPQELKLHICSVKRVNVNSSDKIAVEYVCFLGGEYFEVHSIIDSTGDGQPDWVGANPYATLPGDKQAIALTHFNSGVARFNKMLQDVNAATTSSLLGVAPDCNKFEANNAKYTIRMVVGTGGYLRVEQEYNGTTISMNIDRASSYDNNYFFGVPLIIAGEGCNAQDVIVTAD